MSCSLEPGETVVVTGRNGSGKSTLLRVLAGQLPIGRGSVRQRPPVVGFLPERFPVAQPFTSRGYLRAMAAVRGLSKHAAERRIGHWAERLALGDYLDTPLRNLSKGSAQKVNLVQALLEPPGLLVMDEPWEGLDVQAQAEIPAIISEVVRAGGSVAVTDHRNRITDIDLTYRWQVGGGGLTQTQVGWERGDLHVIEVLSGADEVQDTVSRLTADGYEVRGSRALKEGEAP
ncbi:ABC transporter ATP-binding protein [Flindersiella endophytica]